MKVIREDPDDDQYVAAALLGRAGFIAGGDRHLLDIREYPGIRRVTVRQFLALLSPPS